MTASSSKPRILVLRAAGINCDEETAYAFERYGAVAERVHVNRVLRGDTSLDEFDGLAIPGGFSYGDDVAGGKVLAVELLRGLRDPIVRLVDRGGVVMGICNGFQALVKMGLLPGVQSRAGVQEVTLTDNVSNRYEDRWVTLESTSSTSVFLEAGERIEVPVAHGEGRYIPLDDDLHARVVAGGHVAFRYVDPDGGKASYPDNPNGSVDDVAGLVDQTGRILGLMPHPERAMFAVHHPDWTSRPPRGEDEGDGAVLFQNAVNYLRS